MSLKKLDMQIYSKDWVMIFNLKTSSLRREEKTCCYVEFIAENSFNKLCLFWRHIRILKPDTKAISLMIFFQTIFFSNASVNKLRFLIRYLMKISDIVFLLLFQKISINIWRPPNKISVCREPLKWSHLKCSENISNRVSR